MNDLTFWIAIIIANLITAQIGFVVFRYFVLKNHDRFKDEIKNLTGQMEKGTLSKLLFRQMEQDLKEKYKTKFYEKWFGAK